MSSQKVWFITGASAGLGLAVTEHVLAKGDIAIATCRKPAALSELVSKHSDSQLLVLKLDVTSHQQIKDAFVQALKKFGRIDILHNNAGWAALGEVEGTPDDVVRSMFETNLFGFNNVAMEAVKIFRDVNKPQGGRLLMASSMAGITAMLGLGWYSASKFAVEGLSEAISNELDPKWNIKVTILSIGGFATRCFDDQSIARVPAHPAYKDTPATAVIKFVSDPVAVRKIQGDATKAAREIYNIGLDPNVPLRVPLGLDAIEYSKNRGEEAKAAAESAAKFSKDLKLDD